MASKASEALEEREGYQGDTAFRPDIVMDSCMGGTQGMAAERTEDDLERRHSLPLQPRLAHRKRPIANRHRPPTQGGKRRGLELVLALSVQFGTEKKRQR